jgi:tetratricopeptide (TPR) repeat protein
MERALELADASGDPLARFMVMSQYGHQKNKENLDQGVGVLRQALDLYEKHLKSTSYVSSPYLRHYFHRLQMSLGIGEFDLGTFDGALKWLEASRNGLKQFKVQTDLQIVLNFLGQTYSAMGRFEDAEAVFKEAVGLFKDDSEPNAWNGYNLAFLGKVYLEWQRTVDATAALERGWRETEQTWQVDIATLVRNYYAELLMHPTYLGRDLDEAERQLKMNVAESQKEGLYRSSIASLSLLSKLMLIRERTDQALMYSKQAVMDLERLGTMPALRSEEVFFNHYLALTATSHADEATKYLEKAYAVLQKKASSISNEEYRRGYLHRVALNQSILLAREALLRS